MSESVVREGRRTFLKRSLVVLAAMPIASACGGSASPCAASSLTDQQQTVRTTLHYMDAGTNPARQCHACSLFSGDAHSCGTCSVVGGSIDPHGTCDSFVARG
jgi:hypothetical protein